MLNISLFWVQWYESNLKNWNYADLVNYNKNIFLFLEMEFDFISAVQQRSNKTMYMYMIVSYRIMEKPVAMC